MGMKICPICEKEFPAYKKDWICCSKECSKKRARKWFNNYRKEMRKAAKDLGNCVVCFKEKDKSKYLICSKCRKKISKYRKVI